MYTALYVKLFKPRYLLSEEQAKGWAYRVQEKD